MLRLRTVLVLGCASLSALACGAGGEDAASAESAAIALVVDHAELVDALQRLDDFYGRADGLGRPAGIGSDFEGVATWGFDVYLRCRVGGLSRVAAWNNVIGMIQRSDEFKARHRGRRVAMQRTTVCMAYLPFGGPEIRGVLTRLHTFFESPEGMARPGGLTPAGRLDAETITKWVFDVYAAARLQGESEGDAYAHMIAAIKPPPPKTPDPPPREPGEYVRDALTAESFAGRGSRGGTFSDQGWTTTGDQDTLWYEITDPLPTGSVEFTVSGLAVGETLNGDDHDLLALYGGPGLPPEPADYGVYRDNPFKVFLRIYGSTENDRPGALKIEWAACGNDIFAFGNSAPGTMYPDIGWDKTKSYRLGLSWGDGKMSAWRDGTKLTTLDYPGTYAPGPLRVRIGSPRHQVYRFMPVGITIRDVAIRGTAGEATVCR